MESRPNFVMPLRGMDQRFKPDPAGANRARDLSWDERDGWKSSGGYFRLVRGLIEQNQTVETNPYVGHGAITSMHWFSQHNGARQWLIYETDAGFLYAFKPSLARTGTPWTTQADRAGTTINDRAVLSTPWQRSQSAAWRDRLYLCNGINRPLVFDGYRWDQAGFDAVPQAPNGTVITDVTATVGTDVDPGTRLSTVGVGDVIDVTPLVCAYRYIVTFVNARGQESPPSAPSSVVSFTNTGELTAAGGAGFVWVDVPVGGPNVVARRLYRTQNIKDSNGHDVLGRGGVFYFHSEIQDNTLSGFEDGLPDGYLGGKLDPLASGLWPSGAKYIAPFKNTMFVAGDSVSGIAFSAPLQPEVFPPDNIIDLGDANLGPVTGMYPTKNALVVFKAQGVYIIKGDPDNGFNAQVLTRDVGCSSPNTIAEVPGTGLVFLSADAVYALQGALENEGVATTVIRLSTPISELMKRLNRSALLNACCSVYHRAKEFWIAVPTIGSDVNNLILVYHYDVQAWSYRENFPIGCMLETHDHRAYLIFGSHDSAAHPGLHVYSEGWADKDGTAIAPLYETAHMDLGAGLYRTARPRHAWTYSVGHGNNDLTFNFTVNRNASSVLTAAKAKDQQYPQQLFPVYGTAVYDGTDRWSRLRPIIVRWDIDTASVGPVHELSIAFAPTGRWMTMIGFNIEDATGEPSNVKPMNTDVGAAHR